MSAAAEVTALHRWIDSLAALASDLAAVTSPDAPLDQLLARAEALIANANAVIPTPPTATTVATDGDGKGDSAAAQAATIVALLNQAQNHQTSIVGHLQRIQGLLLAHGRHDDRLRRTLGAYATPDPAPPRYIDNRH